MTFREPLAIEAYGLVKAFGAIRAVDRLDLSVPSGGVFTLLGPNGAGKTTTIRILTTLTRPDAGVRQLRVRADRFQAGKGRARPGSMG